MLNSSVNTASSGMALTSLVGAGVGVGSGAGGSDVISGVRVGAAVALFPMVGVGVVFAALQPKSAAAITAAISSVIILFAFKFSSNSVREPLIRLPQHSWIMARQDPRYASGPLLFSCIARSISSSFSRFISLSQCYLIAWLFYLHNRPYGILCVLQHHCVHIQK